MGKRGHHEGTIYQRADGRYEARLTLPGGRRKSFYGPTRRDVEHQLTAAKRDRDLGLPIINEQQTVGQYLAWWLETVQPDLKPRTYVRYEGEVRNHLVPALGSIRLAKLSAQHLQSLYTDMTREGYAAATVAHLHAVMHKALDSAMRLGHVQRNVADLATAPSARRNRREMHPLTREQADTLLTAAEGERLEALYVLALSTGMRLGEMLALQWPDVDLSASTLRVRRTLHHTSGGQWHLTRPKTAKGVREIGLTASTVDALRAHHKRQLAERLAAGAIWHEHAFVFTRRDGEPLRGTHVLQQHFRPLLARAGLPAIRFHDLRHTAATLLLGEGINELVISQMLGHADISITLGVYGHVTSDMQREATAAMERLLGSDRRRRGKA